VVPRRVFLEWLSGAHLVFSAGVCANLKSVNRFGEGLECLKIKLIEMSSLVENGIQRSIDAVVKRDQVAADEVMVAEARINLIELEIDALAIELLAHTIFGSAPKRS
jgi:hypothetical protein